MYKSGVVHVQSSCFADKIYYFFGVLSTVRVVGFVSVLLLIVGYNKDSGKVAMNWVTYVIKGNWERTAERIAMSSRPQP